MGTARSPSARVQRPDLLLERDVLPSPNGQARLDSTTRDFYCSALTTLLRAGVPFLVGGAYAFQRYTGIERHTKDLDVFKDVQVLRVTLDARIALESVRAADQERYAGPEQGRKS